MEVRAQVWFSPHGGCAQALIDGIAKAKKEIKTLSYSFTSEPIAQALVDAHKRGVDVSIVLDRSQPTAKGSQLGLVFAAGIPVRIDSRHAISHNKVMLIDRKFTWTGSFNHTVNADSANAENYACLESAELNKVYAQNWQVHHDHSDSWTGKMPLGMAEMPAIPPEVLEMF